MAGYITTVDDSQREKVFEFHVGENVYSDFILHNEMRHITEVQLDGDEMSYIVHYFVNFPYSTKNKVQTWRGDLAKFIVENWK